MNLKIICCGNRERGDDGMALLVAERLRDLGIAAKTHSGEGSALIDAWGEADDVIVVDAVVTGAAVGTVQTWSCSLPALPCSSLASTHGFGVAEAIRLARVLDRLPKRLRVYGIEGGRFEQGADVSSEVKRAVEKVVGLIAATAATQKPPAVISG